MTSIRYLWLILLLGMARAAANEPLLQPLPIGNVVESVRAQVVPARSTVLSSGVSARIADLSLREGDSFAKGDKLLALDCTLHRARLAKARAVVEELLKTWEVNVRLGDLGSVSTLEVDVAAARLAGAEADRAMMEAQVSECTVLAPFSGRVARLAVKRHQYVAEGEPLFELIDDSELEVEMIVPSRWLAWLDVGAELTVNVEELSEAVEARVVRTGARIDPVSQSIKVFAALKSTNPRLMAGMSGTARFPEPVQ